MKHRYMSTPEAGTHKGTPLGDRIARAEKERANTRAQAWHNEMLSGKRTKAEVKGLLSELSERARELTRARLNELADSYVVKTK